MKQRIKTRLRQQTMTQPRKNLKILKKHQIWAIKGKTWTELKYKLKDKQ